MMIPPPGQGLSTTVLPLPGRALQQCPSASRRQHRGSHRHEPEHHAPKAEPDIAGIPITVGGEPVNDNEAAVNARIEHEVDAMRDSIAVMAVAIVVLAEVVQLPGRPEVKK
jgi:hypothetical protein